MTSENKEDAPIRWQNIAIAQLGYTVNLVLALTVATLGFEINLLTQKNELTEIEKWVFLAAGIFLSGAFVIGLLCVINRLRDFRITRNLAKESKGLSIEIDKMRKHSEWLGRLSWIFFWFQMVAFGLGVVSMTIGLFCILIAKFY